MTISKESQGRINERPVDVGVSIHIHCNNVLTSNIVVLMRERERFDLSNILLACTAYANIWQAFIVIVNMIIIYDIIMKEINLNYVCFRIPYLM